MEWYLLTLGLQILARLIRYQSEELSSLMDGRRGFIFAVLMSRKIDVVDSKRSIILKLLTEKLRKEERRKLLPFLGEQG